MAQRKRAAASIITKEEVTPRIQKHDDDGRWSTTKLGSKVRSAERSERSSKMHTSGVEAAAELRYSDQASL